MRALVREVPVAYDDAGNAAKPLVQVMLRHVRDRTTHASVTVTPFRILFLVSDELLAEGAESCQKLRKC